MRRISFDLDGGQVIGVTPANVLRCRHFAYVFEYSVGPKENDSERHCYEIGETWDRNDPCNFEKGLKISLGVVGAATSGGSGGTTSGTPPIIPQL